MDKYWLKVTDSDDELPPGTKDLPANHTRRKNRNVAKLYVRTPGKMDLILRTTIQEYNITMDEINSIYFPISGKTKFKKGDCSTVKIWYDAKCAMCERCFMEVAFGSTPSMLHKFDKTSRVEIIKDQKGNIKSCHRCFNESSASFFPVQNFKLLYVKTVGTTSPTCDFVICGRTSDGSGIPDAELKIQKKNAPKNIRKM